MPRYKIHYYSRDKQELCFDETVAENREEASQTGAMLYGDDFRVALKINKKGPKRKPKIRIS